MLSWNVRSLRDGPRAVAALLRTAAPDLVVLQEAPRLLGWRGSRARLARRAGLRVATRDGAAGNLLLVAPHVRVVEAGLGPLPRHPGLHRRAVAWARVELHETELVLAGTHLDLDAAARLTSARRVREVLPPGRLVLGADLNCAPGEPAWRALAAGLVEVAPAPTFPAAAPVRVIDGVLTDLPVRAAEVLDVHGASDHRALLVQLALPRG